MSDTPSFISEKRKKIEENYRASVDLFTVLRTLNEVALSRAEEAIKQVNNAEESAEKIKILHGCVITLLNTLEQAEQNLKMGTLRYQHECSLLDSMSDELNSLAEELEDKSDSLQVQEEEESQVDEEENSIVEEAEEAIE